MPRFPNPRRPIRFPKKWDWIMGNWEGNGVTVTLAAAARQIEVVDLADLDRVGEDCTVHRIVGMLTVYGVAGVVVVGQAGIIRQQPGTAAAASPFLDITNVLDANLKWMYLRDFSVMNTGAGAQSFTEIPIDVTVKRRLTDEDRLNMYIRVATDCTTRVNLRVLVNSGPTSR